MAWVAVFELFFDAWEDAGLKVTIPVSVAAFGAMIMAQNIIHDHL